jgi:hypothetical protein
MESKLANRQNRLKQKNGYQNIDNEKRNMSVYFTLSGDRNVIKKESEKS